MNFVTLQTLSIRCQYYKMYLLDYVNILRDCAVAIPKWLQHTDTCCRTHFCNSFPCFTDLVVVVALLHSSVWRPHAWTFLGTVADEWRCRDKLDEGLELKSGQRWRFCCLISSCNKTRYNIDIFRATARTYRFQLFTAFHCSASTPTHVCARRELISKSFRRSSHFDAALRRSDAVV